MLDQQRELWDVWYPFAVATGVSFACGRADSTDVMWLHSEPDAITSTDLFPRLIDRQHDHGDQRHNDDKHPVDLIRYGLTDERSHKRGEETDEKMSDEIFGRRFALVFFWIEGYFEMFRFLAWSWHVALLFQIERAF